jgi:hypothetical protein
MRGSHVALMLAGAAVIAVAAGVAVVNRANRTAPSTAETVLFPGLTAKLGDVAAVDIQAKGKEFSITRSGETWGMASKGGYPVGTDKVAKLAFQLADLKGLEPRTGDPALYDRLNVGDPAKADGEARRVALKAADGKTLADLIVGKTQSNDSYATIGTYVRKPTDAQSWLASGAVAVETDAIKWLDRTITRLKKDEMTEAELTGPDGTVKLFRPQPDKPEFQVADLAPDKTDGPAVVRAMSVLEFLDFDDVRKADGLDFAKAPAHARYVTQNGIVTTVDILDQDGKPWARVDVAREANAPANEAADTAVKDLKARVAGWAYQLNSSDAEALRRNLAAFTKKDDQTKTQ